jgi:hypothetical protein
LTCSKGETLGSKVSAGLLKADDLPALRRMLEAEEAATRPATPRERMALLEALFQHYPPRNLGGGERQFWLDWHSDTAELPVGVLAAACEKWRRSGAKWSPAPGQLLERVDRTWTVRRGTLRRAIELLEKD